MIRTHLAAHLQSISQLFSTLKNSPVNVRRHADLKNSPTANLQNPAKLKLNYLLQHAMGNICSALTMVSPQDDENTIVHYSIVVPYFIMRSLATSETVRDADVGARSPTL